jgi:geranylgeranyl pyrophosphate synthase
MSALERALDQVRDLIASAVPRSSAASRQLREHGFGTGKLLRPNFLLTIAYDLGCERHPDVLASAAAAELLHEASLVHDDILDDTSIRRGKPTLRLTHGDSTAILLGDKLLAAANRIIAAIEYGPIRRLLTYTTESTIGAALTQHGGLFTPPASPAECLRCIGKLTAGAFRAAATIPTILADLPPSYRHAFACHGLAFGTAYQLLDDATDIAEDLRIGRVTYATLIMRHRELSEHAAADETIARARDYLARALHPPLPLPTHSAWISEALRNADRHHPSRAAIATHTPIRDLRATA